MTTNNLDYLELIENHKKKDASILNIFEKILVISTRAKDLQQLQNMNKLDNGSFGYKALREYNRQQLTPKILEKIAPVIDNGDDEEE